MLYCFLAPWCNCSHQVEPATTTKFERTRTYKLHTFKGCRYSSTKIWYCKDKGRGSRNCKKPECKGHCIESPGTGWWERKGSFQEWIERRCKDGWHVSTVRYKLARKFNILVYCYPISLSQLLLKWTKFIPPFSQKCNVKNLFSIQQFGCQGWR